VPREIAGRLIERRMPDGSTAYFGEPRMWMAAFVSFGVQF
jgi:hypothetical protein